MNTTAEQTHAVTPLQRANWAVIAAQSLAERAKYYAAKAIQDNDPHGWLFWAMRSVRAGKASLRLLNYSRRHMRVAVGEERS